MKLKFFKKADKNCVSILTKEDSELEFNYVEMIKQIYLDQSLEEAEISDEFTEEEKESIESLISDISQSVKSLFIAEADLEVDSFTVDI